jgi:protoporphyrinogen oxidase
MKPVAIIGGGIAGLTAAYELSKNGWPVEVFEKNQELGGQAGTFVLGGARLERFYHHIFTNDRHIIALIEELGLSSLLQWREPATAMFWQGKTFPFASPLDLLRFEPLGFLQRIRLGIVALFLMRYNNWRRLESVTAEQWVRRWAGSAVYETIWGPLLRGKFGSSAGQVSMTWLWGKIHLRGSSRGKSMQRERLGYLDGSFQVLVDELRARIEQSGGAVRTGVPVERLVTDGDQIIGVQIAGQVEPFERVVATVPSFAFLRMVPNLDDAYAARLRNVNYQAAVCLVLEMDHSLSPIYWLNIADRRLPFVGVIEHTNFIPMDIYHGSRVLYITNYLSASDSFYSMSKEELIQHYLPYLHHINPAFNPGWVRQAWLFRDDAGQPIFTTNFSQQVPDYRTPIKGLYLANTTQIYPEDRGMNYSVRLGEKVSRIVMADVQ